MRTHVFLSFYGDFTASCGNNYKWFDFSLEFSCCFSSRSARPSSSSSSLATITTSPSAMESTGRGLKSATPSPLSTSTPPSQEGGLGKSLSVLHLMFLFRNRSSNTGVWFRRGALNLFTSDKLTGPFRTSTSSCPPAMVVSEAPSFALGSLWTPTTMTMTCRTMCTSASTLGSRLRASLTSNANPTSTISFPC